ncbi:MFS transporter [Streptomyces sp. NPDC059802]|uniref:MFS transporter n=1 Tax=Streptomyces sp. NPDC059802 TaxID=3346952 RepID=UPI00364CDFF5
MLSTLAVFAVGFVMRPLGALFFGWFSDRIGRQRGMVLSMGITAFGSLIIAVSPTYASAGAVASALLLLARLMQGFGIGGEIGASHTRTSPRPRRPHDAACGRRACTWRSRPACSARPSRPRCSRGG